MPMKDIFSWNTILSGYVENELLDEAKRVFHEMPVKNVVSWTTILSGYVKNGLMDEATGIFHDMPCRDSISWEIMILGCNQNGDTEEALRFFIEATRECEKLSTYVFACVLSTCADIAAFELGNQIHGRVVKGGIEFNCDVGNALVSLYCRCGNINEAYEVFERIEDKDVISWNTIITGYARHGFGQEALHHFESMKSNLTNLQCHTGLIDKGKHYFYSMSQDHGIVPNIWHYTCLIDLLGRAGRLDEAQTLMKSMSFEPNAATWGTLLGACRIHGNIELGEKSPKMLFYLEPWNSSMYVRLSNLYAASGRWEDVKKTRSRMKGKGLCIRTGYSWVEVLNKIHKFSVGDFTHPDSESICAFLDELDLRMKEDVYVPATKSVLRDVEEEEKQHILKYHSERLAVAYGIMKIQSGRPVRVFKNLRVCEDCHTAIKHIAKITGRLIILRDANRFHHFEGGVKNCGDYW
uniref:Pentatricopeptide repeat protein n=1 Tax=Salvia miltiorrhiza TaxID=226208 RepID=A0A678WG20_SALMI|nr:pentatricopeptide repeat protein [Salvia miltiorrhiza]